MPNEGRPKSPMFSAIFAGFALIVSICAGLYTSFGLNYQRKQFAQNAFLEYARFRESPSGSILQCAYFMLNHISDTELKALLEGYPKFGEDMAYQPIPNFKYDRGKHAGLKDCLEETDFDKDKLKELKNLFEKDTWSTDEKEDEVRKVRDNIVGKLSKNINFLDIGLIGYKHGGGDKEVMCENFATYLDAGWRHPAVKYGILGRFIERLIKLKLVRDDNFPSLYAFTRDLSRKTIKDPELGSFTKPADCSEFRPYPFQEIIEWIMFRIFRAKSVPPENAEQQTSNLRRTVY